MARCSVIEEPPYPLPPDWKLQAPRQGSVWWIISFAVIALTALGFAIAALLQSDPPASIIPAAIFVLTGLCLGVVTERTGDERGDVRFINAVTLTNASRRPVDSWIHFFREAPPRRRMVLVFGVIGLVGCALAIIGIVQTLAQGHGWLLLILVPVLLVCALFALAGGIGVVIRFRLASWARRATGYAVGAGGISSYLLDAVQTWSWDEIESVSARAMVFDVDTGDYAPYITVHLRGEDMPEEFAVSDHEAHAWVIYCAMRLWHECPDLRGELSTTFAQQRMEGWAAWIRQHAGVASPAG